MTLAASGETSLQVIKRDIDALRGLSVSKNPIGASSRSVTNTSGPPPWRCTVTGVAREWIEIIVIDSPVHFIGTAG